jgi:hypothetical protein
MIDPSTALATLKAVASIAKQSDNIPLQSQIIELQMQVMELISQNMSQQQELVTARARIIALEVAAGSEGMQFDRNAYWTGASRENSEDGPYCPACWGDRRKKVHMTQMANPSFARCGSCRHEALVWPEKTPPPPQWGTGRVVRG